MQVRAPETEDRLLRIADHEESVLLGTVDENPLENAPLDGISVLEFIHDGVTKPLPEARAERGGLRILLVIKRVIKACKHVLEALQAAFALVGGKLLLQRADG